MEKNLTKNFDNQNLSQENNFDNIKITLASPEKLNLGPMVKLKNQRRLIIELLDLKKMVYSVLRSLVQLKIMNVYVENINV